MTVVIISIIVLIFLMTRKIKVELVYAKEENTNHLIYQVSAFGGLIHFKRKTEFKVKEEELSVGVKTESTTGERTKSNVEVKQFIRQAREFLNNFDGFLNFTRVSLKRVKVVMSSFDCQVGTENAVTTAQIVGLIWALYGATMSLVQNTFETSAQQKARVIPAFNTKKFHLKYECIFDFSLGHFIFIAIQFIYKWQGKRKYLFVPVLRQL